MLTRKALLDALKSKGFAGDETIDAIKAFIEANAIDLQDDAGNAIDVDSVFNTPEPKPRTALKIAVPTENKAAAVNGAIFTPKMDRIRSSVKRYDAKAKAGTACFADGDTAYQMRSWLCAKAFPNMQYERRGEDEAIAEKVATTVNPSLGGVLLPDEYRAVLIDNIETYGAARQVATVIPMRRGYLDNPKIDADFTAYWASEAGTLTASDMTLSGVGVTARKLTALGRVSGELFHDSELSFMDLAVKSMARAFAAKEDGAYFLGDGGTSYGHILGIVPSIRAVDSTIANIYAIQVATGNLFSEFVIGDWVQTMGRVKSFALQAPKWVMSTTAYHNGYLRAAMAQGGVTLTETNSGKMTMQCLGHPVVFSQVMPIVDANSQAAALFGAFDRAAIFGDTLGMAIEVSDQRYFDTDETAIRGIERIAISVHDVGSTSAYGPVSALYSAAS